MIAKNIIDHCQCWIKKLVIDHGLCPFARKPYAEKLIRYSVSKAETPEALLIDLQHELMTLQQSKPEQIETTVLIHPYVLQNFLNYNDFLDKVEQLLESNNYIGEFQVASFHPEYQFSGTEKNDAENYTNRSPYPMLHLLREQSIEKALMSFDHPEKIPERNVKTMNTLGEKKLRDLLNECKRIKD